MRRYFHDLSHVGRPTDAVLRNTYGLWPLPLTRRDTFAGWTDGMTTPPEVWYDNAAAALNPPDGWVAIDHEDWPQTTQDDRLLAADKFVTLYTGLKSRRPDLNFAFYGYCPKKDVYKAITLPGHPSYIEWQKENDDMAAMAAVVDGFLPSIYWFYDTATNGPGANNSVLDYFEQNLAEARRLCRTYGDPNRPIFPYIWWRRNDNTALVDPEVWSLMIDVAFSQADGCILWGGWEYLNSPTNTVAGNANWDDTAPWWSTFRSKMPKTKLAGAGAVRTRAGG